MHCGWLDAGHDTRRDLLSPSGDPNLKVTRRYKRRLDENHHGAAVGSCNGNSRMLLTGRGEGS